MPQRFRTLVSRETMSFWQKLVQPTPASPMLSSWNTLGRCGEPTRDVPKGVPERLSLISAPSGIGWFRGAGQQVVKDILASRASGWCGSTSGPAARFHRPQVRKPLAQIVRDESFGGA